MSLSIVTICEAVKTLLNSDGLRTYLDGRGLIAPVYAFTAERIYHPVLELPQLNELKVFVWPAGRTRETDARVADKIERRVMVAVKKRFKTEVADCDGLVKFVEALEDYFAEPEQRQLTVGGVDLIYDSIETEQLFSPAQLRKLKQFSAGFTISNWTIE